MGTQTKQITLEEFKSFFLGKAYDVVGNGAFRKHMTRCKDVGDVWAVDMATSIQTVQNQIKDISVAVQSIPPTPNKFHEICKDVMMSAQPPTKLYAGCVTCSITGKQAIKCLDLSKTHKSNSNMFVNARFCYFFMLLWYCNKIEYIIRSFTRTWLDSRGEEETYQDICKAMQEEMQDTIHQMHRLFVIARDHITATIQKPKRIDMSANHKYFPEHLIRKAESYQKFNQRISLELGQDHFTLSSEEAVTLASFLVASYHNQYVCLCNSAEYEDADWVDAVEEFNEEI